MHLIFKCWGFFLPVHHPPKSALFNAEENTVDTFCWYKLPLAEAYQIHQPTGVLKCLGKIIMVIVHILVITTFLTFIRWLLHTSKLADHPCCASVAFRDCLNTATVFGGTGRQRGVSWSCLISSQIKLINYGILVLISIWLWKKLLGLFLGRSEFLVHKKQQTIFKSQAWRIMCQRGVILQGCPGGCRRWWRESWNWADYWGLSEDIFSSYQEL